MLNNPDCHSDPDLSEEESETLHFKRERQCHLVPPDTILHPPVAEKTLVCIWQCYPVPRGGKQFVGKMSAEQHRHRRVGGGEVR